MVGWLVGKAYRLMNQVLRRTLSNDSLKSENLCTVLCDCESILNSRPLNYISEDSGDLVPEIKEADTPDLDKIDCCNFR